MPVSLRLRVLPSLILLSLATWFAGCASDDQSRRARGPEQAARHLPTLVGQETFFDGKILAEVRVGVLAGFDRGGDGSAHEAGGPGHRRGGFGGPPGGGGRGHRPMGGEHGAPDGDEEGPRGRVPGMGRPSGPPVRIHLRLTNRGAEAVEVTIADFLSPLGNFVVTPEKLSLDPGVALEVNPMTSALAGEVESGEIQLRLKARGASETKTISLHPEAAAAP